MLLKISFQSHFNVKYTGSDNNEKGFKKFLACLHVKL